MRFKIETKKLLDGLNKVEKALSRKTLIPILTGIKFTLVDDGLYLVTSDGSNVSIKYYLDNNDGSIKVEEKGSIVIPKNIIDIIRKVEDKIVSIEVIDGVKVQVRTEKASFVLNGYEEKEYQDIDFSLNDDYLSIDTEKFKNIINAISFATSTSESHPILNGINFKIVGDIMELNATDSFRLARAKFSLKEDFDNKNVVIPTDNLNKFIKILDTSKKEEMEIHFFSNKIIFKNDNLIFLTSLIDGNFPNTAKLFPSDNKFELNLDRSNLYNVIDRASILGADRDKNLIMISIKDEKMVVSSSSDGVGNASEEIPIDKKIKDEFKIGFISKTLLESLRNIPGDVVNIKFVASDKAITVTDKDNEEITHLLLPMRLY